MSIYQEIKGVSGKVSSIRRVLDDLSIPLDEANEDYQEYLEWLEKGNKPASADGVSDG